MRRDKLLGHARSAGGAGRRYRSGADHFPVGRPRGAVLGRCASWRERAAGLAVATLGYIYPVVRYVQRLAPGTRAHALRPTMARMMLAAGLSGVALLGHVGAVQWMPTWADDLTHAGFT